MRTPCLAAIPVLLVSFSAWADELPKDAGPPAPSEKPSEQTGTLRVGESKEINVGWAAGLYCEDPSIVQATLVTGEGKNAGANVLKVTGLREGSTGCRAGTVPGRPQVYYRFTVRK